MNKSLRSLACRSLAILISALLLTVAAEAATVTVMSTADGGGSCPGGSCTLRQAILTAAPGDTINFSLPANSTITLTSAELVVNKNLTISGPGANLLIVRRSIAPGTPNFRIFFIDGGSVIATISGLTIADGRGPGGGIYNFGTLTLANNTISGNRAVGSGNDGGGILNNGGTMTITNCNISGNFASEARGGGIYTIGQTNITNSTISGNAAVDGGGLRTIGAATIITNCTISVNSAGASGGGISNLGTVTLINSTVSNNTANGVGGGIYRDSGTVNARNTIIASNSATTSSPDFDGTLASQGYNLIGNTSGTTITGTTTGNQLNVSPMLGPLQDNGGPTRTRALLAGSPAIDKGSSGGSPTDQRSLARPVDTPSIANATSGDGSDIGAYEVQADQLIGCSGINRVVNNNNDSGTDSLRAVMANVCAGSTITFAPSVTGVIDLTSGALLINKRLIISGPGANVLQVQRAAAAGNFRIFTVSSVIASISGLTIANGSTPGDFGGGFSSVGTLTVSDSTISANSALLGGGGIYNNGGTLTLTNATVSGNSTGAGGGGILNNGPATIINSTISGNIANGNNGGGIAINAANTLILTGSTISSNSAPGSGGGVHNPSGTVSSKNTIIALNTAGTGPDFNGALMSQGFNLIGNSAGATITPAQASDQIGSPGSPIDPLLGSLQNNGGPTSTRALLPGSPAIDKGHASGSATDQRGFTRTFDNPAITNVASGDGTDIGAFELFAPICVSRKTHGAGVFDIDLPLTGAPGIECRTGGGNGDHQVVLLFPFSVTVTSASITTGIGSVSGSSASGGQVTVNLAGVANAQTIVLTLGTNAGNATIPMGVLLGDTNADRFVNSGDAQQTRNRAGQATGAANFRSDVNIDGFINSGDTTVVRSRAGSFIP